MSEEAQELILTDVTQPEVPDETEADPRQDFALPGSEYTFSQVQRMAVAYVASGQFKDLRAGGAKAAVATCVSKILIGLEHNILPSQALAGVYFVNGRHAFEAQTLASILGKAGYSFVPVKMSEEACTIEVRGPDGEVVGVPYTYTMAKAKQANLTGKGPWKTSPENMLFARALTNAIRFNLAGKFGGTLYLKEELEDVVPEPPAVTDVNELLEPPTDHEVDQLEYA